MDARPTDDSSSSSNPSVTRWLHELQQGDNSAAARLWEFLHRRLMLLAQQEVGRGAPTTYDEEDVALSAFDALCRTVQQGRYAQIADRDELWRLLAVITINKARNRARDENRLRRGGGFTRRENGEGLLDTLASPDVEPEVASIMQEECQKLLSRLERKEVQLVALLKVEGYTDAEIAQQLGCTRRAVQRRLALIRDIWNEESS